LLLVISTIDSFIFQLRARTPSKISEVLRLLSLK